MWGSNKNKVRQPLEVEVNVNSQMKTETKDPNTKEGDTEDY